MLPVPVSFFCPSLFFFPTADKPSSIASLGHSVSLYPPLFFFPLFSLSSILVLLFCYHHLWSTAELTCLEGKQPPPPFSCSFCLSLLLSLHSSLPVLCPAVALEGSVYPAAAEAGFVCPRASPWKGIFHLWRLTHCVRWHWVPNCATSKFGILVL